MHVAFAEMKSVITGLLLFSVLLSANARKIYNTFAIPMTARHTSWTPSLIRKTCTLVPDRGPCRANIQMYYYDPAQKICDKFEWGGCMGNGNRFDTKDECNISCLSHPNMRAQNKAPRYCQLTFDYGFCFGEVKRYYYDRLWRVCKETLYSGCGGNRNNFYNFAQCEEICRFGHAPLEFSRSTKGLTRKVLYINPKTTSKFDVNGTTKATIPPKF